jgi:hypothetical protein
MGHCGKFGYALWATAANLVIRYGQGFGYALWAIAQGLVSAMGHSEGFA